MVLQTILVLVGLATAENGTLERTFVLPFDDIKSSSRIVDAYFLTHVIIIHVCVVNIHLELCIVVHVHFTVIVSSYSSSFMH